MRTVHPGRILYVLFGAGTFLVFLLGAAAWHTLLNANSLDCAYKGAICLFIPDLSDWHIHLISYALMAPLIAAIVLCFSNCRKQWAHIHMLSNNLSSLAVRDDKLEKVAANLGLKGRVQLLDSEEYISFCAGLASPHIFLSRAVVDTLNPEELEALLIHEKCHLENRDPLKIMLGHSIISALFFAPVLKDLFRRFMIRKEIAADASAIRYQGHRRGIVSALQKLLEEETRIGTVNLAVAGTDALKCRVNYILGRASSEPIPLSRIAISSLVPALAVASIVIPLAIQM